MTVNPAKLTDLRTSVYNLAVRRMLQAVVLRGF